ncbi:peptide-N-glycosidase F-related protein [Mangrovimonas sp. ST2L15]|uniref:peptide-N-glycosidase F-related protein n=1 Tax=Mangrovimonas sp. ST2L15 TaxID=1645916 RepID=UPI0006B59507|nr:peptide-N-glycosidase F-related protein [Mangrovimonas sp. ST2L15]
MKLRILIGCFLILGGTHFLLAQNKSHVISHNQEVIVTDPSKGENSYKHWVKFPSKKRDIRSIILNLTFECPDSINCAHWDYADKINIRSKKDTTVYEIARMLTPYGAFYQKDWSFKWQLDVTDFSMLLRDDIEVEYIHTGYEDNKQRGWKISVDFEITFGEPVAHPLAIHKVYDGKFRYGDKNNPIESHLTPQNIKLHKKTSVAKIKILHTGHGMDANGCGEFCSKYREVLVNDKLIDHKDVWTSCGSNPLYPQAGTWIFDRANWCPGYLLQPDELVLPIEKGQPFVMDINMEPYETEDPSADEVITAYVIEYEAPNNQNDVSLLEVIEPSGSDVNSRRNPTLGYPIIKIKNNGSKALESLDIQYGLKGEPQKTYQWKGYLAFGETQELKLPEIIFTDKETAMFQIRLSKPNGKKDAFSHDNSLETEYKRPDHLPKEFVVYYKTNQKQSENIYGFTNAEGQSIFVKDTTEIKPNKVYRDTIRLKEGLYQFKLTDSVGDGLDFWYHDTAGRGEIRFEDLQGRAIKHFNSDFGNDIVYNFKVYSTKTYHLDTAEKVTAFPRNTYGPVSIDYFSNTAGKVTIKIVDREKEDQVYEEHYYPNFKSGPIDLNLSYLTKNQYYKVVVLKNDQEIYSSYIRVKE